MKRTRPKPSAKATMAFGIGTWLISGETGISSEFMAGVALGGAPTNSRWHDPTPGDASDLGRCVKLVDAVPSVRATFSRLRKTSPVWAAFIDHWDELVRLWRRGNYQKTTARMNRLRVQAEKVLRPKSSR